MIKINLINDATLYQWDTKRKLKISGKANIEEVHFSTLTSTNALVVTPKDNIVNIPSVLLQTGEDIFVYLVEVNGDSKQIVAYKEFNVYPRAKPDDYIYTEDEVFSYEKLENRLGLLEKDVIKDIQIDNKSIVNEEKIVNIPVAADGALGIVKTGSFGIKIDEDGTLKVDAANKTDINEKNQYKPITANNLEYAVQMGLISNEENLKLNEQEKEIIRNKLGTVGFSNELHGEVFNDYENNTASGEYSHAEGVGTNASGSYQHVQGKWNDPDTESKYAHIVGNGNSDNNRSNAHTLDWDGNAWFAEDVFVKGTSQNDAKKLATEEFVNSAKNDLLNGAGDAYDTLKELGDLINENADAIETLNSITVGKKTTNGGEIFNDYTGNIALAVQTHAEGRLTQAVTRQAHSEGDSTLAGNGTRDVSQVSLLSDYGVGAAAHAEGIASFAKGGASHAEGYKTQALEAASHAEGNNTSANSMAAHAEGFDTVAGNGEQNTNSSPLEYYGVGAAAHAEGIGSFAKGNASHAEGYRAIAEGNASHVEGYYTVALGDYQHAQGKWNVLDTENKYAHIVGNGDNDNSRSNAHTLDWDGNAWFAGKVTVGPDNKEVATKDDIVADEVYVGSGEMPAGYVLQIDPTGEASGIVEDVKINDTSIVTDGVANIPVVGTNILGLAKTNYQYGINTDGSGFLFLARAVQSHIDERKDSFHPITPKDLDYAVKAALTDGKGEAYTSEEQQAARERLGVVDVNEIYIGDGEMPEGCVLRINPEGEATPVVNDVKINDKSIVEGGVANIPVVGTHKLGLVKTKMEHGMQSDGTGYIYPLYPNATELTNRTGYRWLSSAGIDRYVKTAMCDGKGPEWTSEEKIAARNRMGIDREPITIDIETTEEVKQLHIEEYDGKPLSDYDFRQLWVMVENVGNGSAQSGASSELQVRISDYTDTYIAAPTHLINYTTKLYWGGYFDLNSGFCAATANAQSMQTWRANTMMSTNVFQLAYIKNITKVTFISVLTNIPIGTKFKVVLR